MELPRQDEIKHQKSRATLGETTVNLDNQFQKAKTTYNRNKKNANNGIRFAILFSANEVVIASCQCQWLNRYKCMRQARDSRAGARVSISDRELNTHHKL
jgi:hypothetical protein